jgi:hypothetical protein
MTVMRIAIFPLVTQMFLPGRLARVDNGKTGKNLRGTTAVNFGAYLLDKIGGREARQDQAGNENGAADGFRSIQREVAGDANEGQQRSNNRLEGDLQQLDDGDNGGSGAEGD